MAPVQGFMDEKLMEWEGGAGAYHNQPKNSTTSWPNLKVETFQIFSWAEILSWAECGNNKLMGPEEIQIFIWEGAPRPLNGNMIDPKTLKFF